MKGTARWVIAALGIALLRTPICPGQEDDGMGQALGGADGVRGTVTVAGSSSFTVKTDEGGIYQVFYSPNTRLVKDRQPIAAADVHVGDMLIAGGLLDAKAKTVGAVIIVDVDAKEVREARAAFGKTWVVGKVTAIHELKITIERAGDKQAQVLEVDENTSFLKHKEDVTLADVKVGDMVSAQGALHDKTFLAATLRIMPPGAGYANGHAIDWGQPVQ